MRMRVYRRRMFQVANTLIERAHLTESLTTRDAYSRRLQVFLKVISVSTRYKYSSVMHTENTHLDTDPSLAMPRKKSSNDDEDDSPVFDLEFDFETNVIWRMWAFAVSEGLRNAIARTGRLIKLVLFPPQLKKYKRAELARKGSANMCSELSGTLWGLLPRLALDFSLMAMMMR